MTIFSLLIIPIPSASLPLLKQVPILGSAFSNQSVLTYAAFATFFGLHLLLYRTPWGLWLRSVGEAPETARAAGLNTSLITYLTSVIVGALCGLAGAQLSLGFLAMFSENMTVGRGFMAYAAVIFGQDVPGRVFAVTLLFGLAEALALKLQLLQYPPQFILMVPYLVTIISLAIASARTAKRRRSMA